MPTFGNGHGNVSKLKDLLYCKFQLDTVIPLSIYHGHLIVADLSRPADWPRWTTGSSPLEF